MLFSCGKCALSITDQSCSDIISNKNTQQSIFSRRIQTLIDATQEERTASLARYNSPDSFNQQDQNKPEEQPTNMFKSAKSSNRNDIESNVHSYKNSEFLGDEKETMKVDVDVDVEVETNKKIKKESMNIVRKNRKLAKRIVDQAHTRKPRAQHPVKKGKPNYYTHGIPSTDHAMFNVILELKQKIVTANLLIEEEKKAYEQAKALNTAIPNDKNEVSSLKKKHVTFGSLAIPYRETNL